MKNNNKFLSFILAVSLTLTSFAGLTITTASADDEPDFNSWNLETAIKTEDFSKWNSSEWSVATEPRTFGNGYGKIFYKDAIIAKTGGAVTADRARLTNGVLQLHASQDVNWVVDDPITNIDYTSMKNADYIYYKHSSASYNGNIVYVLTGDSYEEKQIIGTTAVANNDTLTAAAETPETFITIIDQKSSPKMAYTYRENGTYVSSLELGSDAVKGIRIKGNSSADNSRWNNVHSVSYGIAVAAETASPSPTAEVKEPSPSPTAEVKEPSPSPTAAVEKPSPSPTAAVEEPSPSPTAAVEEPSPSPTATAEPTIDSADYWTKKAATYSTDFTDWTTDDKGKIASNTGNWTLFNNNRGDGEHLGLRNDNATGNQTVLKATWSGYATYNDYSPNAPFYYEYEAAMYDKTGSNDTISLVGLDGNIVQSPVGTAGDNADTGFNSYLTVVDVPNDTVYTYKNDILIDEKTIAANENITGITFKSGGTNNALWVNSFSYGIIDDGNEYAEPSPSPTATAEPILPSPVTTEVPVLPSPTATAEAASPSPTAAATVLPTHAPADTQQEGLGYWTIEAPLYDVEPDKADMKNATASSYGDWTGQRAFNALLNKSGGDNIGFAWNRWLQYNVTPATGVYYYQYTIEMSANQLARLIDTTVSGGATSLTDNYPLVVTATGLEKSTFTTVVDADNSIAYTYDAAGELVDTVSFNGAVLKGIQFASVDNIDANVFRIYDFKYGIAKDDDPTRPTPAPSPSSSPSPSPSPTPIATEEPKNIESKLSDWDLSAPADTEAFDGKSITTLQNNGWKFGNTTVGANFNEKHVIVNGSGELEVNWYGTATYAKTDEENSYYYTYTVKTKDTTGIRSVYLSGADNSTMLDSANQITAAATSFTTVVDVNSKRAYTYNTETGDFVSVVDIPDPAAVKGIVFAGGTVNTSVALTVDDLKYGLVNIEAPEKPVSIVIKGDAVNNGDRLENGQTYEVTVDKFDETVIALNAPYAEKDGKTLLYMDTTAELTVPEGAGRNIAVDGTRITALEELSAGTYNVSISVSTSYKGEEYASEAYTLSIIKPQATTEDVNENYAPVITTSDIDGEEIPVNTTGEGTPTDVYSDLDLTEETSFANIVWSSDKPDVVSNDGTVTRPLEDATVVLTASIRNKYDNGVSTKKITVQIKGVGGMLNDALTKAEAAIVEAYDGKEVNLSDLHQDIKLYVKYAENETYPEYDAVSIDWTSSNNTVLKINGDIAEIYPTATDKYNITLTVTAEALGQSVNKDIPVTVYLYDGNAEPRYAVRCDDLVEDNFAGVADLAGTTVSSSITVPTKGLFGSSISWTSSVPNYISNTGKYTMPSSDTSASLTAVVSKGTVMSDKSHTYRFTLQGKNKSTSSGGGGGGSSSGSGGSSYSLPMSTSTTTSANTQPSSNAGNYNPNANTEPEGFTDIDNVAWAEDAINALADKGIISGRSEHIFDPDANITRAEFATIIVKAFGFEDADATVDEFADVTENDWYYSFVAAAYNNGIISGYDNGTFGSSDNVTRQDMAVIIYRAANAAGVELSEVNDGKTFDDEAEIAAYAVDAVTALVKAGVINGMTDTLFAPAANATRAQAAKMTYELIK